MKAQLPGRLVGECKRLSCRMSNGFPNHNLRFEASNVLEEVTLRNVVFPVVCGIAKILKYVKTAKIQILNFCTFDTN